MTGTLFRRVLFGLVALMRLPVCSLASLTRFGLRLTRLNTIRVRQSAVRTMTPMRFRRRRVRLETAVLLFGSDGLQTFGSAGDSLIPIKVLRLRSGGSGFLPRRLGVDGDGSDGSCMCMVGVGLGRPLAGGRRLIQVEG